MAINFPDAPTAGQKFTTGGRTYQYNNSTWEVFNRVALPKNRVINPAMQVSQQNGDTDAPYSASTVYFPADQWECMFSAPGSSTTIGRRSMGTLSPGGYSIFMYSGTPGDYANGHHQLRQWLEGNRMADFLWGTPQAKPIIMRFWAASTFPGTFCCKCTSGALDRSYCAPIVIPAPSDIWRQYTVLIPGCTDGTWNIDTRPGMLFGVIPGMYSSAWASAPNTWVTGDRYGFPGMSFFNASGAAVFNIFNFEIYLDPYGSGVAPDWVQPQYAADMRDSQRYWWMAESLRGVVAGGSISRPAIATPVPLRVPPSISMVGTVHVYDGAVTGNITAVNVIYQSTENVELELGMSGALTGQRVGLTYRDGAGWFAVNARF